MTAHIGPAALFLTLLAVGALVLLVCAPRDLRRAARRDARLRHPAYRRPCDCEGPCPGPGPSDGQLTDDELGGARALEVTLIRGMDPQDVRQWEHLGRRMARLDEQPGRRP